MEGTIERLHQEMDNKERGSGDRWLHNELDTLLKVHHEIVTIHDATAPDAPPAPSRPPAAEQCCGDGAGEGFGCGKPVNGGTSALGAVFHKECFVCAQCGGDLSGGFYEDNGYAFDDADCMRKHKQEHMSEEEKAKLPRCGGGAGPGMGCGEICFPGTGGTNALGAQFHSGCFSCAKCKGDLSGGFCEEGGSAYCSPECMRP